MKAYISLIIFLFLLTHSYAAKPQTHSELQKIANERNMERECKLSVYMTAPTMDQTWLFKPTVEQMADGLNERRAGQPSSFNVIFLAKEVKCSTNIDWMIDEGGDAYVEIVVGERKIKGGVSQKNKEKIISHFTFLSN